MSPRFRFFCTTGWLRKTLRVCLSAGLIASGLVFGFVSQSESQVNAARTARATKFTVCHRTNAIKNPYRRITVAFSSVDDNENGHDNPVHDGPVFNFAAPTSSHGTVPRDSGLGGESGGSNNRWGDIFYAQSSPAIKWNANNWFVDDTNKLSAANVNGQAIFDGTAINALTTKPACRAMTAADYIRSEMEAQRDNPGLGITMQSVMQDLDDMESSEDFAVKKSLGGSFKTWYDTNGGGSQDPSIINAAIALEAPAVTTEPPTVVLGTSATLNGTVSPKGDTMSYYFEFNTDSTFPDGTTTETIKTDSASVSTLSFSFPMTGLTPGTTYYYRTVGVVTNGLAGDFLLETVFYGATEQFNSNSPASPTSPAISCGNQSLNVSFTSSITSGVDTYEYSVDGGDWQTATLVSVITNPTNSFPINSLLNGTEYSVRIRAFETTDSITGFSSTSVSGTPCGLPDVTTRPATLVESTSATLNGLATSNGAVTTVTFEYKSAADCSAVDFSTATSVIATAALSSTATDSTQEKGLTGLIASTKYCYRIKGVNTSGTSLGSTVEFTTGAVTQPLVTTTAATSVTSQTATLNGTGTPNGAETTAKFTYKAESSDFSSGATTTVLTPTIGAGSTAMSLTLDLTGLTQSTTYYFKASVSNSNTSGTYIDGVTLSFTTPASTTTTTVAPTTTTVAPTTTTIAPTTTTTIPSVTGALRGITWVDMNRNDVRDENEPFLKNTKLVATQDSSVASQSVSSTGVSAVSFSLSTDENGYYEVPKLAPGKWTVAAVLSIKELDRVYDSVGAADWKVTTTVPVNGVGVADFAAAGKSTISLSIPDESISKVDALWAGSDSSFCSKDDLVFTGQVTSGKLKLTGVPNGNYRISETDSCETGVAYIKTSVAKSATTAVTYAPQLPQTGAKNELDLSLFALVLLTGGTVIVASRRRKYS
jgi:LPXTG-motif cell wall-anchored protein